MTVPISTSPPSASNPPPVEAASRLHRWGRFTARRRRPILIGALLTLIVTGLVGSGALNAFTLSRFESPGSESVDTRARLAEDFDIGSPNLVLLVTPVTGDVNDSAVVSAGEKLTAELADHPKVAQAHSYWSQSRSETLRSQDGDKALVVAYVPGDVTTVRSQILPEIKSQFNREGAIIDVAVGGSDELFAEAAALARQDFLSAELIIIPALLVLLIAVYRRTVPALLTLGVGLLAMLSTLALLRAIAGFVEISTFAANLTLVMGIGLAVDYCLFMISRFREETAKGLPRELAIANTVATAGRTVIFSAVTVAASLSVLLVFPFPFLQSFAYAGVLVPVTAALGAVGVLPAAIAVFGGRIHRQPAPAAKPGLWSGLAMRVMRRPILWAGAAVAVLLTLGSPFLGVNFGVPDERVLPETAASRVVQDQITADFVAEETDALQILIDDRPQAAELAEYAAALSRVPGIAQVDCAAGRFVDGNALEVQADTARFTTDSHTWISAVPTGERLRTDPYGLIGEVRAVPASFDIAIGGYLAELSDFQAALLDRLPLVLALIVLVTFVVLFLMTGSLIAPIKATILNMLSLSVMFGAVVWIFQDGNLSQLLGFTPQGSFEPSIPILMFCIAYGLSMDYEVFLLSRIKEEYDRSGDNVSSIATGLQRSAPLVTAAAAILALTFAVYGTGEVVFLQMLGIGTALAIIVDATLIRGVLLPALMRLTGDFNWWAPRPLRNLHDRIGLREAA